LTFDYFTAGLTMGMTGRRRFKATYSWTMS